MSLYSSPSDRDYDDPRDRHMPPLPPVPRWVKEELEAVEAMAEALKKARQDGMGDIEKEKP